MRPGSLVTTKEARAATAAMMTGSLFGSRDVGRTGTSSTSLEAVFSHNSQLAQFGFFHRGSSRATRSTTSAHSSVRKGIRKDWNPPAARSNNTRLATPRQPMAETTAELSNTARGLCTAFLFHALNDGQHRCRRFGFGTAIRLHRLEPFEEHRLIPLLHLAYQSAYNIPGTGKAGGIRSISLIKVGVRY